MSVVASLNVGGVRRIGTQLGRTGIDKVPVDGPVRVAAPGPKGTGGSGLAGDAICDTRHHGGDDQAVYAYAREDLDAWEAELGTSLRSGTFGENLTTHGCDVTGAVVGERWQVGGEVVLQVTSPRIPCATFAAWMGRERWLQRFVRRAVPGAYLRVLAPGEIRTGDPVVVTDRPDHGVTVQRVFRALTREPGLLPGLLVAGDDLVEDIRQVARRESTRRAEGQASA